MKHIFIINPAAGSTNSTDFIKFEIVSNFSDEEYEIYTTERPKEATAYVRRRRTESNDHLRFYACGGDGTLNEVVNGAMGMENVSVACFPTGSGNDYVKYYGGKNRFLNFPKLSSAKVYPVDIMDVDGKYCINVCNFGFDSVVAASIAKYKHYPLLSGKKAYYAGVAKALFKGMKHNCTITVDGKQFFSGDFLLCTIANGNYVGSTFKCAPHAVNDDGLLEICLMKKMSRFKFFSLVKAYTNGEHLDDPKFKDIMVYCRGKNIEVSSPDEDFAYSLDGEMHESRHFFVNNLQKAIGFAVPAPLNS